MADYDNTIALFDENGNKVEFEVVHYAQYKGETYLVLWSEESDAMPIVVERDGDYEVVDDNDAIDHVRASFAENMVDLKLEIDSLSDDLEDLIEHADDLLDEDIVATDDENVSELEPSISPIEFDYNKYILQSQDYLFKKALSQYNSYNYEEAMSLFISAQEDGNIYAAAHIGIMYYYGEGCNKDKQKAFEYFKTGYKAGCPLAAA